MKGRMDVCLSKWTIVSVDGQTDWGGGGGGGGGEWSMDVNLKVK